MGIGDHRSDFETSANYRTRIRPGAIRTAHSWRLYGSIDRHSYSSGADGEIQQTYSLSNPAARILLKNGRANNIGGPFFTRRVRLSSNCPDLQLDGSFGYHHQGPLYPAGDVWELAFALAGGKPLSSRVWQTDSAMSRSDLNQQGVKMMLSANPTKPAFRAADALAELVADQSLASIPGAAVLKDGKPGLAGEYLNLQFALLPTISDAQKLHEASMKSEVIMTQFLREAGRVIRRTRRAPTVTTSSTSTNGPMLLDAGGSALSAYLQSGGRSTVTSTSVRDVWFEGAYKSLMSKQAGDFERALKAQNAVYGFVPNPKSIWEATPYSWLIDYFVNAQSFIHATFMAGIDGSVLVRGYVMCTTHTTTEYTWSGNLRVAGSWKPYSLSYVVEETIKQRESARPYGIGFSGAALTGKQLSILAALGISRFAK